MSWKCQPRWKLPNGNFYPTAMACAVNEGRQITTVMVTNGELVVSLSLANMNRTFFEDLYFTQCDLELHEPIRALEATDTSVFLISSDGQLMVNDLVNGKFVEIATYNRVLHVERSRTKSQLFVVRQMGREQIVLEVVDSSTRFLPPTITKRYDLVMEAIDASARFCIKSFVVNEANKRFLGDFLGFTKHSIGDSILLIAINNSLYWLMAQDTGECDLIAVRCFATCVIDFELSESCLCLTVLLQSGVLVVFSESLAPETLTIATSSVYLTVPIEAFAFEKDNNAFLYSNGLSIQRVHFYYSEETNQIVTEMKEILIRGVIAIAMLDSKSMALLLTDNNQFYTVDCSDRKQTSVADVPKMFVLGADKRRMNESMRMTKRLTEEVHFDKRLDEAMQTEQAKFDVLALHKNQAVFERLSRVGITFTRDMPSRKGRILCMENQKENEGVCLFASLKIEINLGFYTLLVNQKSWSIYIQRNERFVTYPVHTTFNPEGVLNGICFINKRELANGFPKFSVMLVTTINHGNENLLLTIPMPASVQSPDECAGYLVQNVPSSTILFESSVKQAASGIVARNNPYPVRTQREERPITYCIRNEQSKTKAVSFSSWLENNISDMWSALDVSVTVSWHGARSTMCLTTFCPLAMDVVKRFLLDNDEYDTEIVQRRDKLKGMFLELQAITDDDLITKLYRKVRNNDIIDDDLPAVLR
ncbi:uncharacterized protein LOC128712548 [Anopheles marshallii]|uniref:uncharacterized protein LOC128712548 n=1 Tax=Anopheles marshallii TaxID=1521116 RepID=UPI00237B9C7B|nr:uncharacterized protein LOC128712548 [Anopheles marshallii]